MPYVPPEIITDVDTLYLNSIERWQNYYPDWEPDETSVLSLILSVCAYFSYEQAYTMQQQFDNIYSDFGEQLYGIPALDPTLATGVMTVTASDTLGHTLAAGEQFVVGGVGFSTDNAVTIAPGSSTTAVGEVAITALATGTAGNGLSGDAEPVGSLGWISTATLVSTTTGGSDAETNQEYRDRLTDELITASPAAITAADYVKFARRVPGAYRAIVLDAYLPFTNLLTANQASFETDTTGWTGGTNTTLTRTTAQASSGAASLSLQRIASTGDITATSTAIPVLAGTDYTARAELRTAVQARTTIVGIRWLDAASATISTSSSPGTVDSTSAWTVFTVTGTAPANAAYAVIVLTVLGAATSEVHYADKIGFKEGASSTWATTDTSTNVYDAATNTYGNPGHITVSTVDETGQPGPSADVLADLNSRRMTGIQVHYVDPHYNTINVTATVTVDATRFVTVDVLAAAEAAVETYLSPDRWGGLPAVDATTFVDDREWTQDLYIRRDEIYTVLNNTAGVMHVDSLSINGNTTTNVLMVGDIPLPQPGTILVTAS